MQSKVSKTSKDVIKFFIAKVMIGIIGLVLVSLYSYLLTPDVYGDYSLVVGVIKVLISIFIGWVGSSALRYYDQYKNEEKNFLSNVVVQWIAMTIVMVIIAYIVGSLFQGLLIKEYFIYVLLLLTFMGFVEIFEKILRAAQKTNIYLIAIVLQSILNVSLLYILAKKYNLGIYSMFIANVISYVAFTLIAIFAFKLYGKINFKLISKEIQNKFFKYGFPMVGIWGVSWFLSAADRYMIKIFSSNYDVGLYDIAYKITENSINMIISSFTLAVFPMLVATWNKDGKEKSEKVLTRVINYLFLLLIPSVVGLIGIREKLYGTIVSEQYLGGNMVILFVGIGLIFNGFNQVIYKLWQLKEQPKKILYFMLVSLVIDIVLNIVLLPKYGYIAAAVTTLISYLFITIASVIAIKKDFNIQIDKIKLLKCCISAAVMFAFLIYTREWVKNIVGLFILIAGAAIVYLITLFITGTLKEEINKFIGKDGKKNAN
ncbi:MAG: polysaccharide biosynthesis C-terminal domain-containing protein [Clostridia bacterium]|nr:polysaccharide biosynthesis C-terminal domain-containing protein [Clostridia bacterium]